MISSVSTAKELTINYQTEPQIFINGNDEMTFIIEPSGKATWIGDLPWFIEDNEFDWAKFHEESKKHTHETQYTKDQYRQILKLVLNVIDGAKPNNQTVSGEGYTNYSISLWGNPSVEFRFESIGGKDFPESIEILRNYLKKLDPPNKKRNEMNGSAEPPIR